MLDKLNNILDESGLTELFELKQIDSESDPDSDSYVRYRVKTNVYRIRSFDLYKSNNDLKFCVRHSKKIYSELQKRLNELDNVVSNAQKYVDFQADTVEEFIMIANNIRVILENSDVIEECKKNAPIATTSKFEGLDLPDIDTSQSDVLGQTFSWREIISIWEDNSDENHLKEALSKSGIYIQRSKDGKSRYIGSAYGSGGIISRWMKHLESNGDAHHLNLFVLEHGYNEVVFSVIEFYDKDDIITRETQWKNILGTLNSGSYNGIQLNKN